MPQNLETLANTSEAGLTQQGGAGGSFNLENLARSFLQSQANKPRDDFIVGRGRGGTPIFDFTKPSEGESIMKGLEGLAMSFLQQKQQKKRQDFVEKVKEIMSSSATTEDKMNGLMQLRAVDPELYKQIGIDDINKTYLETMKLRGGKIEKKPTDLNLWKQAEKEVRTSLGGSSWMGLDEEVQAQYYPKIKERFNQLQKQFGKISTEPPIGAQLTPGIEGDKVRVRAPDGKIGTIPRSQLQAALKAGYKQIK